PARRGRDRAGDGRGARPAHGRARRAAGPLPLARAALDGLALAHGAARGPGARGSGASAASDHPGRAPLIVAMRWAFPHGELGTWLALGAVTERSVRVWLRAPGNPSEIARLRLDGRVAAQARLTPDPAHDHIAVADLVLDSPAPNAPFTVEAAGLTRRGRLAPALGTRAAFSFALGSCHYPFAVGPDGALIERAATRIYPAMAHALRARDSRFLLLVGDQVYADVLRPIDVRSALRQRYATEGRLPPLADVVDAYRHVYRGYFNQPGLR